MLRVIFFKFGGFLLCFDETQGSSTLFLGILGVSQSFLVNLNLLSHLFLPMTIF
jgi:hypothetical protein